MKDDIESTEIAIAFPLPPRDSEGTISLETVKAFIQGRVSKSWANSACS